MIPPVVIITIILIAVYILLKSVFGYIDPENIYYSKGDSYVLLNVVGTSLLLLGITIVSRVPRLSNNLILQIAAWLLYFILAILYSIVIPNSNMHRGGIKEFLDSSLGFETHSGLIRITISTIMVGGIFIISKSWPSSGVKPLIITGSITILGILGYHSWYLSSLNEQAISDNAVFWPVILAILAFFYLWWLAAMMFDLMFVWYLYIRQNKALENMDEIIGSSARDYVFK